jgi:hypothetical protein
VNVTSRIISMDAIAVRRWFVIAYVTALALRIGMILALQTYKGDPGAYEHAYIAAALVHGDGFSDALFSDHPVPTSVEAPAMPLLLSLCFRVAGVREPAAYLLMEFLLVALAGVGVWTIGRIGAILWDEPVGLVAAWGFAVYPPLLYMVTRVQAVNWTVTFLLLSVYCMLRLRTERTIWMAMGTGACLAIGALGEPTLLATALAALLLLLAWREVRLALVLGLAVGVTLAPWMVRNTLVHHRFVLIKSNFWYVFWGGNNLQASGTDKFAVSPEIARALRWRVSLKGLEAEMTLARQQATVSIDSLIPAQALAWIKSQPREIDKLEWFKEDAKRTLREHPWHYVQMCGKRAFELAWFDDTNPRSLPMAYRLPYILLLVLAVAGIAASLPHAPLEWPVPVVMSGALALVHILVITSARFRLPLEAMMLLPAAYGSVWAISTWRQSVLLPRLSTKPLRAFG